ncbi:MAG: hypothetical protein JW715_16890 [Sedimentisphaerales bacterium]|nr:hypothetical protein [Sedimentisphaerales bacterium]
MSQDDESGSFSHEKKATQSLRPSYAAIHGCIIGIIVAAVLSVRPEFIFRDQWSKELFLFTYRELAIGGIAGGVYAVVIKQDNIFGCAFMGILLCVLGESIGLPLVALPVVGAVVAFFVQLYYFVIDKQRGIHQGYSPSSGERSITKEEWKKKRREEREKLRNEKHHPDNK